MGGQTVLYDMAADLQTLGYECCILHAGPHHRYTFTQMPCPVFQLPTLKPSTPGRAARGWVQESRMRWSERKTLPRNPRFERSARDVFVLPEFAYPHYSALFPEAPVVLVAQDPAAMMRAYARDDTSAHQRITSVVATSDVAEKAIETLLGRSAHRITLSVARPQLQANHPKKLQIAYMPRKLKPQAENITRFIAQRPGLADVPLVPIRNMTNEERDQAFNESLIFLSFSNMEGFGLPPAEAMAAGCIVIGYTGNGGNEYFTDQTGFVIEQSDMISFAARIEEVVTAWRTEPAPLDALRAHAAAEISARYNPQGWAESLRQSWAGVVGDLEG